jgi:cation diffusion facilitator CzcD-associated flavoprotein CzcO
MVREPGYSVEPQWHSQRRKIRVICVGAGAAGLLVAYKLKKNFKDYELVCYEKSVFVDS